MLSRVTGISVMLGALFLPVAVGTASDAPVSFAVGQRWEYRTRPQDAGSTLVIVKINADTTHGNIISISVSGLRLKNPHSTDGLADTAQHMPFAESALRRSVTKLLASDVALPPFQEGYDLASCLRRWDRRLLHNLCGRSGPGDGGVPHPWSMTCRLTTAWARHPPASRRLHKAASAAPLGCAADRARWADQI